MKNLEHVQELDLKIDHLKRSKDSLPSALKTLDDSLSKIQAIATSKQNALGELEKTQRQTRAAMELNQERLTRSSTRLEGVKNSQEFQAVSKELEQLRKLSLSLEEQIKKSTQDSEAQTKELQDLDGQLEKVRAERAAQAEKVSGQSTEFESQIAAISKERSTFATHVEPRILSQYDRIRAARAGLGLVPAVGGRCKGCNMMVPPQLYNEVQKANAVQTCPSCHRILYIPTQSSSVEGMDPSRQTEVDR